MSQSGDLDGIDWIIGRDMTAKIEIDKSEKLFEGFLSALGAACREHPRQIGSLAHLTR